jgi:hypothetical protein
MTIISPPEIEAIILDGAPVPAGAIFNCSEHAVGPSHLNSFDPKRFYK